MQAAVKLHANFLVFAPEVNFILIFDGFERRME